MKATKGSLIWASIWLDNITRELLTNGSLKRYLDGTA
jgi:hypothetical protein